MEKVALIIAGGKGERFWPKSRMSCPKQFLNLANKERTMIQLTVERVAASIKNENIYIITNVAYKELIKEQLPQIPAENVIYEPMGKNTAPAIGLGVSWISEKCKEALVAVLPSDHLISPIEGFTKTLEECFNVAAKGENIVTVGIEPTYPETGYGYIECEEKNMLRSKVKSFAEKPNAEKAKQYLDSGDYLWNSGISIWKISTIMKNIEIFLPQIYAGLSNIKGSGFSEKVMKEEFEKFPSESIDYGVLEKAINIYTVKADFDWDDMGTWKAVDRTGNQDNCGNIMNANSIRIDTHKTIVDSKKKLVVTVGLENLLIVDTDDVLLVMQKDKNIDMKEIIEKVKEMGVKGVL